MKVTNKSGFLGNSADTAWLVLVGSTLLGWWLGHTVHTGQGDVRLATAAVLLTAFVKTWIVGFQFMELRHAPRWLRHSFDAWVIVICITLIVLCV